MATTMTNTQGVTIQINGFKNRLGGPAAIDGKPRAQTDNSDVLAITTSDDGMTITVNSTGMPGTATVFAANAGVIGILKHILVWISSYTAYL